jgi:glyoxylase-like metal-dependent hydrolase (beta-lactamase superfamily II)
MPLPPLPVDLACPPADTNPGVKVEVVATAFVHDDWRRVVDDGTRGPVAMPVLVGILRHPDATVLVDAGLGLESRDGSYPGFPLSALGDIEVPQGQAIVERLEAPPDLVLMTHLHYDHVGGLLDLPGVPVWTTEEDWRAYGGGNLGFPPRMRRLPQWQPKPLRAGSASQVLGQPALDVLGDGSLWYLSLPGHTPGAAAVLVRAEDGPWLFIGDTAWVDKHLGTARRPPLTRAVIDAHPGEALESLEWARWLKGSCPDLRIVAGHEPAHSQGLHSAPGG